MYHLCIAVLCHILWGFYGDRNASLQKSSRVPCVCNESVVCSASGNPVQQIGLSLPVIIIKQEETCQCQCACRDSAKERSSSQNNVSSQQEPKDISPPPPTPSDTHAVPECCSTKVNTPLSSGSTQTFQSEALVSSAPSDSLASVDVVDLLSPETTAKIEALLMVTDEFSMGEGNSNTTS